MYVSKRDEEIRTLEDKLKWMSEQYLHLDEAHKKLHGNFLSSKAAWENEKSLLLEVIKMNGFNLQSQLKICSQALANEENTRKLMEAQVSEYKKRFQNISLECHEDFEKLRRKCRENLKEKEVECKTQIENARKEMNEYLSKMKVQTAVELKSQLEAEKYVKIIQDKESRIENLVIGFEQEKKSLLRVIEERNQRIEEAKELEKEMTNALTISEEKQIQIDVIHQGLHKLEIEVFDLREKIKVKDKSLLQYSQHTKKLEKEMTNVLQSSEEKQIKIDVIHHALHKLDTQVVDLREKLEVKDEYLLQASQHANKLEGLIGGLVRIHSRDQNWRQKT